ncbi:MAG TPA: hypothetical protein VMV86_03875, partial [Methanosarcinales archaeon]|nr:hypothetical protein [Methanosarcinales archaeon]
MKKAILYIIFLVSLSSYAYALSTTDDDLIGYWELDDATTTMTDSKDNILENFNLKYTGDLMQQTAIAPYSDYSLGFNKATFDAYNKSTVLMEYSNSMEDFTISFWADLPADDPTDYGLFSFFDNTGGKDHGVRVYFESDGTGKIKLNNFDENGLGGGCGGVVTDVITMG